LCGYPLRLSFVEETAGKPKIENNMERIHPELRKTSNARTSWGVLFVLIGGVLILNVFGVFPYDVKRVLFSWEMLLIVVGLFSLINNESKVMGIILIALGVFLMGIHFWDLPYYFRKAFWPAVLLVLVST